MRCLVTGAAGFIGSHLSAALIDDGCAVVGLDDLSTGSIENLAIAPQVELVVENLCDEEAVTAAAQGCKVIFHLGAIRSVPRSMAEPGLTTDVNVRGTVNVLTAAHATGARVVFASSSSVYGDQLMYPLSEEASPDPRSPYAASKLAGETCLRAWWHAFHVPTVSLRYFNVYGPGQSPESQYAVVVPLFIRACLTDQHPIVHGDGNQARDFTYIEDAVDATICAAHATEAAWGQVFNVGGGRAPTSINALLGKVAELTGSSPHPLHTDPREGDVRLTHADLVKSRRFLGYEPQVSINEGLRRSVAWMRKSLDSENRATATP